MVGLSEEKMAEMRRNLASAGKAAPAPMSPAKRVPEKREDVRAPKGHSGSGLKGFLMGAAAVGAGIALWFGGQKQGAAKAYREAPQASGIQLIVQQHQQKGAGGVVYAQPSLGQEVNQSYEDSVRDALQRGKIKNAVATAQQHGALKTAVAEHAMGLPEKAARVTSAQMDTELAWEGASQADARARTAHSDNETMWENTAGRIHNIGDAVGEGRRVVDEVRGLRDAFKSFRHSR